MRQVTIQQADSKAEELTVLKANLHTHTTNSDGTFSPSEVIGFYADAGYDVLAFTDHRTTNRVSEYDAEGMTLLSGIELHPAGPRGIPWLPRAAPRRRYPFDGRRRIQVNAVHSCKTI